MAPKISIVLSYSYHSIDEKTRRFVNDLHKVSNFEIIDANRDFNAGNDYFNFLHAAILNAEYFITIPSFEIPQWQNSEYSLNDLGGEFNHNLKVIHVKLHKMPPSHHIQSVPFANESEFIFHLEDEYENGLELLIKEISKSFPDKLAEFPTNQVVGRQTIIQVSSIINERLIYYFQRNPEQLKKIERRLFEEFIAEIFHGFGYEVELTQQTRDGGRDIIAIRNSEVFVKYLIECKRPDPGNPIGIKPVRELFGVKQDEKATKAILATTSFFTSDAKLFFERNKWELEAKDFDGIMKWVEEYKKLKIK